MIDTALTHLILIAVCFIFLFPCLWLILASFSKSGSIYSFKGFFPQEYSLDTFRNLFTDTEHAFYCRDELPAWEFSGHPDGIYNVQISVWRQKDDHEDDIGAGYVSFFYGDDCGLYYYDTIWIDQ